MHSARRAALLGEPAAARHRRTGDGGETGAETTARRETVTERASTASDRGSRDGGASEAAVGHGGGTREAGGRRLSGAARRGRGSCQDARRAVPTAALSRGVGVARGGHAAAARCARARRGVRRLTGGARCQ
jgi:hypothetical protein